MSEQQSYRSHCCSVGSQRCETIRISEPIKRHWAAIEGLNLQQLLGDGPYKERYRRQMIEWSDEIRSRRPDFFCQSAFATGALWVLYLLRLSI